MTAPKPLHLVLCWHMHQPDYREHGEYFLPWTYLHAVKDYTDMAAHLERYPDAHAVVNLVPVLLDQIEDYARQFESGRVRDPLLRLLHTPRLDDIPREERALILDACFRAHPPTHIDPYPAYKRLHAIREAARECGEGAVNYLSGQYLGDVLTWYHLTWTGETVRREREFVIELMSRGEQFSYADRLRLFELYGELICGLIPRYRRLAERGQVELSATPHHHPLAPLLLDFHAARESEPKAPLPTTQTYPGGEARVRAHLRSALASHAERFGTRPAGVWPAEGGISDAFLRLLDAEGVAWCASGEGVLRNSLACDAAGSAPRGQVLYRPYSVAGGRLACFFRDEALSDRIGFEYARWHGEDAVRDFVLRLEATAREAPADEEPVVSVILDGENAWEYYPYNGYYFLDGLYRALSTHPFIRLTTFRDYLAARLATPARGGGGATADGSRPAGPAATGTLPRLTAGSWVYGSFSTWIGSPEKNHAWDLLCAAKTSFDLVAASDRLSGDELRAAERQLAECEASDWFWWFGDYNPRESVESFDALYRRKLAHLYQLLKLPPPAALARPISHGGGPAEVGGAMRRAS